MFRLVLGLQLITACQGSFKSLLMFQSMWSRIKNSLSPAWWLTRTGSHTLQTIFTFLSIFMSIIMVTTIPLDKSTKECTYFITKLVEPFGYIFVYGVWLPVAVHAFYVDVYMFRKSRRYLKQEVVKSEADILKVKHKSRQLCFKFSYYTLCSSLVWLVLLASVQIYFIEHNIISNFSLSLAFMYFFLLVSMFCQVYLLINKRLQANIKRCLATYAMFKFLKSTEVMCAEN